MGFLGLLWAALKFLAPAFGTAFASAAGTQFGTRLATALAPEASAQGVAPSIVAKLERSGPPDLTPQEQRAVAPIAASVLRSRPEFAATLEKDVRAQLPTVAQTARQVDEALRASPTAGQELMSGAVGVENIGAILARNLGFTEEHAQYWNDFICPVGREPALEVTYVNGLGKSTAMTRGFPDPIMNLQGQLVPNTTRARCARGHSWSVFTP
jgi:hypothetical protein